MSNLRNGKPQNRYDFLKISNLRNGPSIWLSIPEIVQIKECSTHGIAKLLQPFCKLDFFGADHNISVGHFVNWIFFENDMQI